MSNRTRELATFADYDGFHAALRARAEQLGASRETLDELAGLPDRYLHKLLSIKQVRRVGATSMGPILGALGVELILVESAAAMARIAGRIVKRNESQVREGDVVHRTLSRRFMREIGRLGGAKSRAGMSTTRSRALARKAALARHADGEAAKRSAKARHAITTRWARVRAAQAALTQSEAALLPALNQVQL